MHTQSPICIDYHNVMYSRVLVCYSIYAVHYSLDTASLYNITLKVFLGPHCVDLGFTFIVLCWSGWEISFRAGAFGTVIVVLGQGKPLLIIHVLYRDEVIRVDDVTLLFVESINRSTSPTHWYRFLNSMWRKSISCAWCTKADRFLQSEFSHDRQYACSVRVIQSHNVSYTEV